MSAGTMWLGPSKSLHVEANSYVAHDHSPVDEAELRRTPTPAIRAGRINRLVSYFTNHLINHFPSYTLRHFWYRRILGIQFGDDSAIFLGCYLWFGGLRNLRDNGLRIGTGCRINRDCCLDARGTLSIGNNVSISPEVTILTMQHRYDDPDFADDFRPVVIEDHVWIGTRAMVMPGVTVGRGAVIAAGAVVTRDVAPLEVVAGIPARPIGHRTIEPSYVFDTALPLFE